MIRVKYFPPIKTNYFECKKKTATFFFKGTCQVGERCVLQNVECLIAPCNPVPVCLPGIKKLLKDV